PWGNLADPLLTKNPRNKNPRHVDYPSNVGENDSAITRIRIVSSSFGFSAFIVGLWRSWERASMAWKRSSVRSRPGPPCFQQLTDLPTDRLVAFGSKFPKHFSEISVNFFPLHSEFSINRVDGSLHALRDFLHIHVGRCGRTGMPEKSLNVLHRSLLLRQRRKYRRRGSTSYSPSKTLE